AHAGRQCTNRSSDRQFKLFDKIRSIDAVAGVFLSAMRRRPVQFGIEKEITFCTMSAMPAPRTRKRRLRNHVCDSIRDHIVYNQLAPGSRLEPIKRLSARFGASFRTVQPALVQLQAEGYVVLRHGSGTYVAEHPPLR